MLDHVALLWRDPALRAVAVIFLLTGIGGASMAPYQSLLAIDLFGLSDAAFSVVMAVAAVVSVSVGLWVGIQTDQTGARRGMALATVAVNTACLSLMLVAPGPWTFVALHAVLLPATSSIFGQLFAMARLAAQAYPPETRDGILAAFRAIFAIPFLLILPLWSVAFGAGVGLFTIYPVILAVAVLIMWLVWQTWPADQTAAQSDQSGLTFRQSLAEVAAPHVLIRVILVGLITGGVWMYMMAFGPALTASALRDLGDVAIFFGLVAGLEVPVMLSMGAALRHVSRIGLILLGAVIYFCFLMVLPWVVGMNVVWLLILPAAVGGGIVLSLPLAYLQDLMGNRPGVGGALIALQNVTGQGAAAVLFAIGTALSGYGLAIMLGAVMMIAAAGALYALDQTAAKNPGPA